MQNDELNRAIYMQDKRESAVPEPRRWVWGRDYGKDLLADINQIAHKHGTDCITRDCLKRAYVEIEKLRKLRDGQCGEKR